jgi:hypothetical protein
MGSKPTCCASGSTTTSEERVRAWRKIPGFAARGFLLWLPRSRSSTLNLSPSIQFGSSKSETACGGVSCEVKNDWLSTVRGRLGYAAGRFMSCVTGGGAFGDIKSSVSGIGSANETTAVRTVDGGVETALSGPWSAKLEYLYGRPRARRHDCWRGRQVRNRYRARRSQLPVFLSADLSVQNAKPPSSLRGFRIPRAGLGRHFCFGESRHLLSKLVEPGHQLWVSFAPIACEAQVAIAEQAGECDLPDIGQ